MKAFARYFLTAALTLGAAVFAWPVQALKCPMPPYWRDVVKPDQVSKTASNYAKSRIKEMQSIFLGRVVSAQYAPFREKGGAYVVTYEVSDWIKGRGQPFAKIAWYPGIPCVGNCPVEETVKALEANKSNAIVFADLVRNSVQFSALTADDLDGEDRPCAPPHSIQPTKEPLPSLKNREYDDVVFRNALRVQLSTLPRIKPQKQH